MVDRAARRARPARQRARARGHREHADGRSAARQRGAGGACARIGVGLAIDDFGTGYSSLAYLSELPIDELKIDRSFVTGMADERRRRRDRPLDDRPGARNLGLRVVAEGVESESVLEALVDLRCSSAQGFHLGRPLPSAELDVWLSSRSTTPRTSENALG